MPKITLHRRKTFGDKLRAYIILLDDKKIGKIRDGATWVYECAPGKHTFALKMDFAKTPPVTFELALNDEARFECNSNITGMNVLWALKFIFQPKKWIHLERKS